jgi:bifunctional DNA-binding transcriptional regulator/antitoxin component of YhaV-PrlF toxin-antitoxin module
MVGRGFALLKLAIWYGKWYIGDMESVITMDKSGRLVLPGRIRKALQISQPAAFKAEVMGNKVELTLMPTEGGVVLKKRRGLLVVSTGGRKFSAVEALRTVREEHL